MFRRLSLTVLATILFATTAHAQGEAPPAAPPKAPPRRQPANPVARFILVGDSTMQPNTGIGGALCNRLKPEVECDNMAKGSRSTAIYRADGSWAEVMAKLAQPTTAKVTYVLIQFGTNDGSNIPERHVDLPDYHTNLVAYAAEVKAAGAIPVLMSPVTQRIFTWGKVDNSLDPYAAAVRQAGADAHVAVLDLFTDSHKAVQDMGAVESEYLSYIQPPSPEGLASAAKGNSYWPPRPPAADPNAPRPAPRIRVDYTHMGPKGAELFSGMVERELTTAVPDTAKYFAAPVP